MGASRLSKRAAVYVSLESVLDGFRTGYSMLRTFLCCSLAFVAMTMPLRCQDLAPQPHVIEGNIKVPGTNYAVVLGAGSRQSDSASREALVDAIKTWLSIQFALAAIDRQPRIEFVPSSKIAVLRVNALLPIQQSIKEDGTGFAQHDTVAIYHDTTQTIYLADDWTGSTPAELSILVHEMVHHFQNMLGLKYECPQAREALAYRAQEQWLGLFGHDLATDFDLDPFSLLVKTKCFY